MGLAHDLEESKLPGGTSFEDSKLPGRGVLTLIWPLDPAGEGALLCIEESVGGLPW